MVQDLTKRIVRNVVVLSLPFVAVACSGESNGRGDTGALDPQLVFWDELQKLCGEAYGGVLGEGATSVAPFVDRQLSMHVYSCDVAEVRIAFHVGDDRSRTWVVTPTAVGLRLRDERHRPDGSEEVESGMGGDTYGPGTDTAQEFFADVQTAERTPDAASDVWTLELRPGDLFAYRLRRGEEVRLAVDFDLSRPVSPPPSPWGAGR